MTPSSTHSLRMMLLALSLSCAWLSCTPLEVKQEVQGHECLTSHCNGERGHTQDSRFDTSSAEPALERKASDASPPEANRPEPWPEPRPEPREGPTDSSKPGEQTPDQSGCQQDSHCSANQRCHQGTCLDCPSGNKPCAGVCILFDQCCVDKDCPSAELCTNNMCQCKAKNCMELGKQCGSWPGGCQLSVDCGACPTSQRCESGACVANDCKHQCYPNEKECTQGKASVCQLDARGCRLWSASNTCSAGEFCLFDECTACANPCKKNETQCLKGQLRYCRTNANGCTEWGSWFSCGVTFCDDTVECGTCPMPKCTPNTTECTDGKERFCAIDTRGCWVWTVPKACTSGTCQSASSCGTCTSTCIFRQHTCYGNNAVPCDQGSQSCSRLGTETSCICGCLASGCTNEVMSCAMLYAGERHQFGSKDGPKAQATFNAPRGIAIDAALNIYIGDSGNAKIRKIDASGNVTTLAGTGTRGFRDGAATQAQFDLMTGLTVGPKGHLYIVDGYNHRIRKYDMTTKQVSTIVGTGKSGDTIGIGTKVEVDFPRGDVVFDKADYMYFCDTSNSRLKKLSPQGQVTVVAGSGRSGFLNGKGTQAQLSYPRGLAIDSTGNLYVADTENHVIRKIDTAGNVTLFAGVPKRKGYRDGPAMLARFNKPSDVLLDAKGRLVVVDEENSALRLIDLKGQVTTLAGDGTHGNRDGLGSAAQLARPVQGAIFQKWLYTVESSGNRVRRVYLP